MSYKDMRKKMASGATGTGKSNPSPSGGVSPSKAPKVKDESTIGQSFRAGPNDAPIIAPKKMGKGES